MPKQKLMLARYDWQNNVWCQNKYCNGKEKQQNIFNKRINFYQKKGKEKPNDDS